MKLYLGLGELKDRVNQFLHQFSHRSIQHDDHLLNAQPVLQWTNHSRRRSRSIATERVKVLYSKGELNPRARCTSEEPESKKRKLLMVDIEELKKKTKKHILSPRKVRSADNKCIEPYLLVQSDISSADQQIEAWDKVLKRIAAPSDAPRAHLEETEPDSQIQHYREEHARRQQEADEAHRRQILEVNPDLEQDSMGKVQDYGPKPRGFKNKEDVKDTKSKAPWKQPQADARAGRSTVQATQEPPTKKRRLDPSPGANASPQSQIDVVDDEDGPRRQSSSAMSGHSQTVNGVNESAKDGGSLRIDEYRKLRKITGSQGRPRNKVNRPGSQKRKEQTVDISNNEDANDPIEDPSPAPRPKSKLEVQIPVYCPEQDGGHVNRAKRQNADVGGATQYKNGDIGSSGSKSSTTSPFFTGKGAVNKDDKSSRARQTEKPVSTTEAVNAAGQIDRIDRDISRGDAQRTHHDPDLDDLISSNQLDPKELKHYETAEHLVAGRKQEQRAMPSVKLDDSDSEGPSSFADIKSTTFRNAAKGTKALEPRTAFGIRQIFDQKNIYLRHADNKEWRLEFWAMGKETEKKYLQTIKDSGSNGPQFLVTTFNSIDFHDESCKVVIHRSRGPSKSTMLLIEFTSVQECLEFVTYLVGNRKVPKKKKEGPGYLEKVFKTQFDKSQHHSQSNTGIKRSPEDHTPDDLLLAMANSARRTTGKFDNAQRPKTAASTANSMPTNGRTLLPRPLSMAASMESNSAEENGHEGPRRHLQSREHPPEDFYGRRASQAADKDGLHGRRSSTRLTKAEPARPRPTARQRTPSPEILGWTRANPNWVKEFNWQKSIDYATTTKNRTTVEKDDIERLDEGEFLNDSLIGFYLGYLEMELKKSNPEIAKRVYFQNSFFYKRLSDLVKGSKDGINYAAVEKWTSKVDIFKYDYIIVPVNEHLHWYVAIICHPSKLLEVSNEGKASKDATSFTESHEVMDGPSTAVIDQTQGAPSPSESGLTPRTKTISLDGLAEAELSGSPMPRSPIDARNSGNSPPPPITSDLQPPVPEHQQKKVKRKGPPPSRRDPSDLRVITLDSFHLGRSPCCTKLKRYLLQELKAKKNIEADDPGSIGMTAKSIPYQENSSDCGLFLLNYVEMFLRDPDQFIKDICQKPVYVEDLEAPYPSASSMRGRVRDLLFEIQIEQHGGSTPPPRKTVNDRQVLAQSEKRAANSTTRRSNEPPQHNAPPAVPSTKAVAEDKDTNIRQGVQASAASTVAKPHTVPDATPTTEASVKNALEATESQKGHMATIYANIVEGVAIAKNTFFGESRASNASTEQADQTNSIIEIDDSTQHSIQSKGESSSRPKEIGDSQAPSSSTSSISKEPPTPRGSAHQVQAITIPDSPDDSKAVSKHKPGAGVSRPRKVRSLTPPAQKSGGRNLDPALFPEFPALGSPEPSPEPELVSPTPEPYPDLDDEVDLLQPFSANEPLNENGPAGDQADDEEMLMLSQDRKATSATYENPKEISPPTSGRLYKGKQHAKGNAESAASFRLSPDQHTQQERESQSVVAKKRKSVSNEPQVEDQREQRPPTEDSSDVFVTGSRPITSPRPSKRQKKETEHNPSRIRGQMVEANNEPLETAKNVKQKKSVGMLDTHMAGDGGQSPSKSPYLDPSDAAIVGGDAAVAGGRTYIF